MIQFLFRIAAFCVGIAFIADGFLPVVLENLEVDQHTSNLRHDTGPNRNSTDTSYQLHFVGGRTKSCSVGWKAFSTLNDGDKVSVRTSKVLRSCTRIEKDGTLIYDDGNWRIFVAGFGVLLLLSAFGKNFNNGDDGWFDWRLR